MAKQGSTQFPIKSFTKMVNPKETISSRKVSRQNRLRVYNDVVVDPLTNPLAYRVRHGLSKSENVIHGGKFTRIKKGNRRSNGSAAETQLGKMSDELLKRLNVGVSSLPKDHTLLYCQFDKPTLENPNIYDEKEFEKTQNEKINTTDNFPDKDDPFYNLDTAKQDYNKYNNVQKEINREPDKDPNYNQNNYNDRQNQVLVTPNLTFIAASLVQINFTNHYPGQLKYFTETISPLSEAKPNDKVYGNVTISQKEHDRRRYGEPIEQNPYDTLNPNKEDLHAQMITADHRRRVYLHAPDKNIGEHVDGMRFLETDKSEDNLRRNVAGMQRNTFSRNKDRDLTAQEAQKIAEKLNVSRTQGTTRSPSPTPGGQGGY
jgi:hypothetical protein